MDVDGRLDTQKDFMMKKLDQFLSLTKEQKQAFSLIQRSYPGSVTLDVLQDDTLMNKLKSDIKTLELAEKDGFNKYIRMLMARQIPQLQSDCWE